ncbi:DUF805 domain-containing protein [Streptomyces sp. NPDC006733]|uniref:DUF805 domain-containing protein n=1 Tax=Streptomyces sp. NPDC006733 TaxID=3155460 RepID=UPI0033F1F15A
MNFYLDVLKQYTNFAGRARRQEYWMFALFHFIIIVVLVVLDRIIGSYPLLYALYTLATFLPTLAVTVRRLHDTGKSGWMALLGLIPCVGGIILIVFAATEGTPGDNQYGPNPKAGPGYTGGPPYTPAPGQY